MAGRDERERASEAGGVALASHFVGPQERVADSHAGFGRRQRVVGVHGEVGRYQALALRLSRAEPAHGRMIGDVESAGLDASLAGEVEVVGRRVAVDGGAGLGVVYKERRRGRDAVLEVDEVELACRARKSSGGSGSLVEGSVDVGLLAVVGGVLGQTAWTGG